jgi:hypothetical protein
MRTIETWLASEESGTAFRHCISCRLPLLEISAPWLVNKEFHRGECLLEYAICQPCRNGVTEGFSEESKETVRSYLENKVDWQERFQEFMMQADPARRFDSCVVCLTPREALEGFGLSAFFDPDGSLVESALPLLICSGCVGEVSENLSKATREAWQRFLEENFDGPPGLTERLPNGGMSGLL